MYTLYRHIYGLHPTLRVFTGGDSITLLGFMSTMRDGLEKARASEAAGMCVIACYLDDEAEEVHEVQCSSVSDGPEEEPF